MPLDGDAHLDLVNGQPDRAQVLPNLGIDLGLLGLLARHVRLELREPAGDVPHALVGDADLNVQGLRIVDIALSGAVGDARDNVAEVRAFALDGVEGLADVLLEIRLDDL